MAKRIKKNSNLPPLEFLESPLDKVRHVAQSVMQPMQSVEVERVSYLEGAKWTTTQFHDVHLISVKNQSTVSKLRKKKNGKQEKESTKKAGITGEPQECTGIPSRHYSPIEVIHQVHFLTKGRKDKSGFLGNKTCATPELGTRTPILVEQNRDTLSHGKIPVDVETHLWSPTLSTPSQAEHLSLATSNFGTNSSTKRSRKVTKNEKENKGRRRIDNIDLTITQKKTCHIFGTIDRFFNQPEGKGDILVPDTPESEYGMTIKMRQRRELQRKLF